MIISGCTMAVSINEHQWRTMITLLLRCLCARHARSPPPAAPHTLAPSTPTHLTCTHIFRSRHWESSSYTTCCSCAACKQACLLFVTWQGPASAQVWVCCWVLLPTWNIYTGIEKHRMVLNSMKLSFLNSWTTFGLLMLSSVKGFTLRFELKLEICGGLPTL